MRRSVEIPGEPSLHVRSDRKQSNETAGDKFERLFGFRFSDLTSSERFVKMMTRPTDPASLGVMRFVFGLLMFLDTVQERGMSRAAQWDDPAKCNFPLFDSLKPLPVEWMVMVYICMASGTVGIMLGFLYKLSCLMFVIPYWYIFLLDKTRWNNHSYLFGLTGVMLMMSDADRYWSVDGYIWKRKRHCHVPLWNYTVLRTQFFLVYFVAGLKKMEPDWVDGYSLRRIGDNWVFYPFQFILTTDQIDLYLVHKVGFLFDLMIGFLLFFDLTRPIAGVFCTSFHLMNSQIFSIGMFPWTMIATTPMFCHADWPRHILNKLPSSLRFILPSDQSLQSNEHCLYRKDQLKSEEHDSPHFTTATNISTRPKGYHKFMVGLVMTYLSWQLFMPYSHFITKGYNSWTEGLYGYSWDMMIHSWQQQHARITYVDKDTGEVGYLKPGIGTSRGRWSSQPDMLKQYAACLADRLKSDYNVTNPAMYFDVWRSMNKRFQQRMWDPRVDILSAPWGPFTDTAWKFPMLTDLSGWREELKRIQLEINDVWEQHSVVFIADFPGLKLDMFIQEDYRNASVKLLRGSVAVELRQENNHTMAVGESLRLPPDSFHTFYTISNQTSCLMLLYANNTRLELRQKLYRYEAVINRTTTIDQASDELIESVISDIRDDKERMTMKELLNNKRDRLAKMRENDHSGILKPYRIMTGFVTRKIGLFYNTTRLAVAGFRSIVTGTPLRDIVPDIMNHTLQTMPGKNSRIS